MAAMMTMLPVLTIATALCPRVIGRVGNGDESVKTGFLRFIWSLTFMKAAFYTDPLFADDTISDLKWIASSHQAGVISSSFSYRQQ